MASCDLIHYIVIIVTKYHFIMIFVILKNMSFIVMFVYANFMVAL